MEVASVSFPPFGELCGLARGPLTRRARRRDPESLYPSRGGRLTPLSLGLLARSPAVPLQGPGLHFHRAPIIAPIRGERNRARSSKNGPPGGSYGGWANVPGGIDRPLGASGSGRIGVPGRRKGSRRGTPDFVRFWGAPGRGFWPRARTPGGAAFDRVRGAADSGRPGGGRDSL